MRRACSLIQEVPPPPQSKVFPLLYLNSTLQRASVRRLGSPSLSEMRLAASRATTRHALTVAAIGRRHFALGPAVTPINYAYEPYHPSEASILLPSRANSGVKRIAILGGGITGLTTAFHLANRLPQAKITIYEKSHRVGGWLDSEIVDVDGCEVLFEWGPRSLRPDLTGPGRATVALVRFDHHGSIAGAESWLCRSS